MQLSILDSENGYEDAIKGGAVRRFTCNGWCCGSVYCELVDLE